MCYLVSKRVLIRHNGLVDVPDKLEIQSMKWLKTRQDMVKHSKVYLTDTLVNN